MLLRIMMFGVRGSVVSIAGEGVLLLFPHGVRRTLVP